MKRMEIHTVARFFFPFRKCIDFESQDERYSICFVVGSYTVATAYILCFYFSPVNSMDAKSQSLPTSMGFWMKEGTLNCALCICCHNGWHLLIMSIIRLFNAFNRVQIWNRWWICRRALNTKHGMFLRAAVGGRLLHLNTLPYRGCGSIGEIGRLTEALHFDKSFLQEYWTNQPCKDLAFIHL